LAAVEAMQHIPTEFPVWHAQVLIVAFCFVIVFAAAAVVVLSILALRGSNAGRYLLIAAWVAIGAFFHFSSTVPWDGMLGVPGALLPALVSVFAVPILLLRRSAFGWYTAQGSMRHAGWIGWLAKSESAAHGFGGWRGL